MLYYVYWVELFGMYEVGWVEYLDFVEVGVLLVGDGVVFVFGVGYDYGVVVGE